MNAREEQPLTLSNHKRAFWRPLRGTTTQNNALANALLALTNSGSSLSNIANSDNT